MYEFYTHSRSAWSKSLDKARNRVFDGKMSRAEFLAAVKPSPDARDPNVDAIVRNLDRDISLNARAKEREKDAVAKREADRAANEAKVASLAHDRVWSLSGYYMEDVTDANFTLAELKAWASSYGYVFGGRFGGEPMYFAATTPQIEDGAYRVLLGHDVSDERRFDFAKAAVHLREWVAAYRSRQQ